MQKSTKAILLRTTKYAETSIIATFYTQNFGIQSYLINGIRKSNKQGGTRANLFMPAQIFQLEVQHQDSKNLQRVKDFQAAFIFKYLQQSMIKNAVAIFCIELINKTIHEPESNEELYNFFEDTFLFIDNSSDKELSNLPIIFALQFANMLGYQLQGKYCKATPILNLQAGEFNNSFTNNTHCCSAEISKIISVLNIENNKEIPNLFLNKSQRNNTLHQVLQYFLLHIPNMGVLKSPDVLQVLFS